MPRSLVLALGNLGKELDGVAVVGRKQLSRSAVDSDAEDRLVLEVIGEDEIDIVSDIIVVEIKAHMDQQVIGSTNGLTTCSWGGGCDTSVDRTPFQRFSVVGVGEAGISRLTRLLKNSLDEVQLNAVFGGLRKDEVDRVVDRNSSSCGDEVYPCSSGEIDERDGVDIVYASLPILNCVPSAKTMLAEESTAVLIWSPSKS